MFALERTRVIRKYLEEHSQAEVHALSELLGVSEVTVRRDLEKLERDGFLVRTHGGAILAELDEDESDLAFEEAESPENTALIEEIGRVAARLVVDGDTIMILNGKISRALSRALCDRKNVTVLTNDLVVARTVVEHAENRVVLLGGDLDPKELALYGPLTHDDIRRFHVNRLFAESDGFGENFELSAETQQKAALIREGRAHAREFVILCLSDHFTRNAFFLFGNASPGDTVVTDRSLSDASKRGLFDANLRLFTALDVFEGTV